MELNIIEPETKAYPLIGREYEFGVTDCFEAMRDYLKSKGVEIPPRIPLKIIGGIEKLIIFLMKL